MNGGFPEIRRSDIVDGKSLRLSYDAIYESSGICHRDSFYRWLLGLLHPKRGATLLDVSCGEGSVVRLATRMGLQACGLDVSRAAVARAKQSAPAGSFLVGDAEALPYPDSSFDYVTNVGSIEHYLHPARGVREMSRVLAPHGQALVLVPNSYGLLWNVFSVWRRGDISDDGQPIQRYGTPRQWTALLEDNGLRVLRVTGYDREWPRSLADAWWYLHHGRKMVCLLLSPFVPTNLAGCLVFVCRKREPA